MELASVLFGDLSVHLLPCNFLRTSGTISTSSTKSMPSFRLLMLLSGLLMYQHDKTTKNKNMIFFQFFDREATLCLLCILQFTRCLVFRLYEYVLVRRKPRHHVMNNIITTLFTISPCDE